MKPVLQWTEDWGPGLDTPKECEISQQILDLFVEFWDGEEIEKKSKSTLNRYRAGLMSLGAYILELSVSDEGMGKTPNELLLMSINHEGGPLLFQDEENWQNEIDMVCRKLHNFYVHKNL